MAKGLTTKEALKTWEEKYQKVAAEEKVVKMLMWQPFITKMDASLSTLTKCEQLSLSTNQIEKITNLQGLQCLRVLSLGRNNIKKIEGLDAVADTLEELWISYNQLERLNGVECCKKLKVLYASNNKIKAWEGIGTLKDLPALEDILLSNNPLEEKHTAEGNWRDLCSKAVPQIKRLDGQIVIKPDAE
ncbi:Dynein light chain 1, axonemal [Allomyces arbusculus]|nr:Dynein light chain 1, axonemal [Allomyces arbusculus]